MKKMKYSVLGVIALAALTQACGASEEDTGNEGAGNDTADEQEEEADNKVVNREDVAESSFTPTALENTVDDLVEAIEAEPAKSLQLKVLLKQLGGYWEPVQLGASRAMAELEVTGGVDAPLEDTGDEAIAGQLKIMRDDQADGYDGFAVAPFEQPVAEAIDEAAAEGIPVITIDSDLPDSERALYIGTMNSSAGKTAGESLLPLLPAGGGTVLLYGHDEEGWVDGFQRTMGAADVFTEAGYEVIVRKVDWTETGAETDLAFLQETVETADPPVVGMMGMFAVAYRCAMAAEAAGKEAGEIPIAAFDFDPITVEYMQNGYIQVTHAQRQYYMGYLSPYVLYGINVLGVDATKDILQDHMIDDNRFDSGLDVVPADKLEDYYSFLDALGISG